MLRVLRQEAHADFRSYRKTTLIIRFLGGSPSTFHPLPSTGMYLFESPRRQTSFFCSCSSAWLTIVLIPRLHKRFQMVTEPVSCVEKKWNEGLLTTFTVFYSPERESIIQVNSGDVGPVQRAVAAGWLSLKTPTCWCDLSRIHYSRPCDGDPGTGSLLFDQNWIYIQLPSQERHASPTIQIKCSGASSAYSFLPIRSTGGNASKESDSLRRSVDQLWSSPLG